MCPIMSDPPLPKEAAADGHKAVGLFEGFGRGGVPCGSRAQVAAVGDVKNSRHLMMTGDFQYQILYCSQAEISLMSTRASTSIPSAVYSSEKMLPSSRIRAKSPA